MLRYEILPVGPLSCNCVLVWDSDPGTGVVVDPGDEAERIAHRVEQLGFRVVALLHTHAHFDHVGATADLQQRWGVPALLHPDEEGLLERLDLQTGLFGMDPVPRPTVDPLQPGEVHWGLRVLATPGHSPGGCSFYAAFDGGGFLLAGDTLFEGGVGRTDLWGGDARLLERSLREVLYGLPDETVVIPGHGPLTTIGREARTNPYVRR